MVERTSDAAFVLHIDKENLCDSREHKNVCVLLV